MFDMLVFPTNILTNVDEVITTGNIFKFHDVGHGINTIDKFEFCYFYWITRKNILPLNLLPLGIIEFSLNCLHVCMYLQFI